MKNFVQDGAVYEVAAPYDVASGAGCLVGGIFGVATTTAASGAAVNIQRVGVFDLVKVGSQAWSVGDKVYWDDSNKRCTKTATDGMLIGVAGAAAGSGAGVTTGRVILNGTVPPLAEGPQAAIADLAAITGGEAPTEAEHNAVRTAVNSILAALRTTGVIAAS